MKHANKIGALVAVLVILSCFLTWITLPELGIRVTGFASEGTSFGKPGLVNCFMSGCAFILFLVPRIWAKRLILFFTGFNTAWAIRNFILLATCHGGECPQKQWGLYLLLGTSGLLLVISALNDLPLKEKSNDKAA